MISLSSRVYRESGFSLLEVLVAFTILAISLGLLMQSFSTSLRGLTLSEEHTKALILAESTLAEVGVTKDLVPGVQQGEAANGYLWRLSIEPYIVALDEPLAEDLIPYLVQVMVNWGEGGEQSREVKLSTLQLAVRESDQDSFNESTQTLSK